MSLRSEKNYMTDREDMQEGQPAELWPGRYMVSADYPEGYMILFQPEMTDEEARELLEPLGFTPDDEDYLRVKSQAQETFTEEQADKLVAFLEDYKSVKAEKLPASKPLRGVNGIGASAVEAGYGFYELDKADDYNLPFRAWAHDSLFFGGTPEYEMRHSLYKAISDMSLESLQELKKWLDERGQ